VSTNPNKKATKIDFNDPILIIFITREENSMNELLEAYLTLYEPVMAQMGFSKKGIIFHRITHEKVVQMLSYTKFSYSFTIQFSISPLCAGYEYKMHMDETRLGILLGNETYAEWNFNKADLIGQLQESLEICREHLFPLFKNVCNYDTYYDYIINEYNKMLTRLSDVYKKVNAVYISTPNDIGFYGVCLRQGNYSIVKRMLEANIEMIESAIKRNKECGISPSQEDHERIKICRNEYKTMSEAMDNNNREFIEAYINEKEEYSLESYIKNFWGKKALNAFKINHQLPWDN
jgi:hypothetical protein